MTGQTRMAGMMRKQVILLSAAALVLSNCGGWRDSRVNPTNWFGRSNSTPVEQTTAEAKVVNPLLPRSEGRGFFSRPEAEDLSVPAATITELRVEPTAAGAIIYAVAQTSRQGAFDAELRPVEGAAEDPAVLELTFRVVYPDFATPVGPERSRTVRAAHTVSTQDLAPVRTIRVIGAQNIRETRRR